MLLQNIRLVANCLEQSLGHLEFDIREEIDPIKRLEDGEEALRKAFRAVNASNLFFRKGDSLKTQLKRYITTVGELIKAIKTDSIKPNKSSILLRSLQNDLSATTKALNDKVIEGQVRSPEDESAARKAKEKRESRDWKQILQEKSISLFTSKGDEVLIESNAREGRELAALQSLEILRRKHSGDVDSIPRSLGDKEFITFKTSLLVISKPIITDRVLDLMQLNGRCMSEMGTVIEDQTVLAFDPRYENFLSSNLSFIIHQLRGTERVHYMHALSEVGRGFFKMPMSPLGYTWLLDKRALENVNGFRIRHVNFPFVEEIPPKNNTTELRKARLEMEAEIGERLKELVSDQTKLIATLEDELETHLIAIKRLSSQVDVDVEKEIQQHRSAAVAVQRKIKELRNDISGKRVTLVKEFRERAFSGRQQPSP